jgi:enoyl-CoA hydratase/carnithine racemase
MFSNLTITHQKHVAIVRLARPKLNAMNPQFFLDIKQCFRLLSTDVDIRCIVLLSQFENVFTAGLDRMI